jgi:hypothetical protein
MYTEVAELRFPRNDEPQLSALDMRLRDSYSTLSAASLRPLLIMRANGLLMIVQADRFLKGAPLEKRAHK